MHIAILTFEGFNELGSLIALGILNRIKTPDWRVTLSCPTPTYVAPIGEKEDYVSRAMNNIVEYLPAATADVPG